MPSDQNHRSLAHIHRKVRGERLNQSSFLDIVTDINFGRFDDVHIAAFLTACAANPLDNDEIFGLTNAMVGSGEILDWPDAIVLDKHCVGGLPGNRTTPIVVAIIAAAGLTIPKTSSRAITSAAGTADTMEVLCPVDLNVDGMRRVVEHEGGCIVWGGNVGLSPVDDDLVRVARALGFDGREQLVASVLSKKIAAGATHAVIDIPVGPSAKIIDAEEAHELKCLLSQAARSFGLVLVIHESDGSQPVGHGIGPALEARDVMAVLQSRKDAPDDLKSRALTLAAVLLEIGQKAHVGEGLAVAGEILRSGRALKKLIAICEAQGGIREIPSANFTHSVLAEKSGTIASIDNRLISRLARLAGAPEDGEAGLDLHVSVEDVVYADQPVLTIHAKSKSRLNAVLERIEVGSPVIDVMDVEERMRSYR